MHLLHSQKIKKILITIKCKTKSKLGPFLRYNSTSVSWTNSIKTRLITVQINQLLSSKHRPKVCSMSSLISNKAIKINNIKTNQQMKRHKYDRLSQIMSPLIKQMTIMGATNRIMDFRGLQRNNSQWPSFNSSSNSNSTNKKISKFRRVKCYLWKTILIITNVQSFKSSFKSCNSLTKRTSKNRMAKQIWTKPSKRLMKTEKWAWMRTHKTLRIAMESKLLGNSSRVFNSKLGFKTIKTHLITTSLLTRTNQ